MPLKYPLSVVYYLIMSYFKFNMNITPATFHILYVLYLLTPTCPVCI